MTLVMTVCEMVFCLCLICVVFMAAAVVVAMAMFAWFMLWHVGRRGRYSFTGWIMRKGSCL